MPFGSLPGALSPHIASEAVRLLTEIYGSLQAVAAHPGGLLYAFAASPALTEGLARFAADTQCDGLVDPVALPADFLAALSVPESRDGSPVLPWTGPGSEVAARGGSA